MYLRVLFLLGGNIEMFTEGMPGGSEFIYELTSFLCISAFNAKKNVANILLHSFS